MNAFATIRPDDWNFPLLLHVFGAMILVGGLVAAATALLLGWRQDSAFYSRFGFRSLLVVALPTWLLMRIGGQWIESKENFEEGDEPGWLGIGYLTADLGGLLLLISIVLTGIAARRLHRSEAGPSVLARIGTVLTVLILIGYILAVWAMTTKPD